MPKAGGYTKKGKEDRKKAMDEALTWARGKKKPKGLKLKGGLYK